VASNEVTLTLKINDNGTLDVVQKKAEGAARSTEKLAGATSNLDKAAKPTYRTLQGTAGTSSNLTKNFAKQAQGIQNGLVPAYATLAANIFAITAAFGALQRAEAARKLEEGLTRVGDAAGRNLPLVAEGLREITGAAISTAQAMETVAFGSGSGFSRETLEGLTKVATGASRALGRDMTESLDRVLKGTAKLEPELLDELGIIVRLDKASAEFGATIGKTADQLTILEQRQAFANAVLDQGIEKYGRLAEEMDPNAYDQLSAAFEDLSKSALNLLNNGLTPIVSTIAGNKAALTGAIVLFSSTISKQMLPALYEGAQASAESANALKEQAEQMQANITSGGNLPKVYDDLTSKIKDGTASQDDYDKALGSLNRSMKTHESQLHTLTSAEEIDTAAIERKRVKMNEVRGARAALVTTMETQLKASAKATSATAIEAASQGNLRGAYRQTTAAIGQYIAAQKMAAVAAGGTIGVMAKLRIALFSAALSFKVLGAAILNAIPIIGQILFIGSLLIDFLVNWIDWTNKTQEALDRATEAMGRMGDAAEDLQSRIQMDPSAELLETAKTMAGTYETASDAFKQLNKDIAAIHTDELQELQDQMLEMQQILEGNLDFDWFDATHWYMAAAGPRTIGNSMMELQERIAAMKAQENIKGKDVIDVDKTRAFITEYIHNLKAFGVTTLGARNDLAKLKADLNEKTSVETIQKALDNIGASDKAVVTALANSEGAFTKVQEAIAKFKKNTNTPFDDVIKEVNTLQKELTGLNDAEKSQAIIDRLGKSFKDVFGKDEAALTEFKNKLQKNNDILLESPGLIKKAQHEQKLLNKIASSGGDAQEAALKKSNEIVTLKRAELIAEKENINMLLTEEQDKGRIVEIDKELLALKRQLISDTEIQLQANIANLNSEKKLLGINHKIGQAKKVIAEAEFKQARTNLKLANAADKSRSSMEITPRQEFELFQKEIEQRKGIIEDEFERKGEAIDMEYKLLDAQARLLRERLLAAGVETTNIDEYISKLGEAKQASLDANKAQLTQALNEVDIQAAQNKENARNYALEQAQQGDSVSARMQNFSEAGGMEALDKTSQKVQAVRDIMNPMFEDMKKLGPDGELLAAIGEGAGIIASSWTTAFETAGSSMEKAAGIAQAVGDTIGAVNNMIQKSIQASIAKLDKQIAAEKKRDGKSAQSVAKIQAMEKKKEAMQRKAFETNKKMLMAQTIANTAAGIMRAIAEGGIAGIVIGAIIAAMGAAQLAIIASQKFEGGGTSAPPPPSKINVGKRQTSVDLATSKSASGELGYLRGGMGTGGPENFKPTGRFSGGDATAGVGVVVGEQGPELFVPEIPGRIETSPEAVVSPPTNVNFSINAIDAAGVEEVLVNQRGTIIGMIREASNAYGQPFMEDVDTSVYTPSSAGARSY